jgi:hypothetical protein
MESAGIERRRGGTVLLTDVFVFAFLALAVSAGSKVGIGNGISVVIFTIVWMSAAITRLTELRRGERPALQLRSLDIRTTAILVVGSGPWVLLGFLQRAYPSSVIWKPIELPPSLGALGIALAVAVIAEPFLFPVRRCGTGAPEHRYAGSAEDAYRISTGVIIRSGAILLLSGSLVFALLCALWLGVALWPARPAPDRAGADHHPVRSKTADLTVPSLS